MPETNLFSDFSLGKCIHYHKKALKQQFSKMAVAGKTVTSKRPAETSSSTSYCCFSRVFGSIWKYQMQWFSWRTCTVRAAGANLKCRRHELLGAGLSIEAGRRRKSAGCEASHIVPTSASRVPAQKKYSLSEIIFSFS